MPCAATYTGKTSASLEEATEYARKAGFSVEWFSDSVKSCVDSPDACALLLHPQSDKLRFKIDAVSDDAQRSGGAGHAARVEAPPHVVAGTFCMTPHRPLIRRHQIPPVGDVAGA
jgi:hypothetical protein